MNYLATSINESPVFVVTAAAAVDDVRGHAFVFNSSGNVAIAGAGAVPLGIGIMTMGDEGAVAQGDEFTLQYKDIGYVCAGAAITKGASLSVDANGAFIPATSSTAAVAIALGTASAAGQYIPAILKFSAPAVS